MGCYNTVVFKCPSCGGDIEEQTKSGSCCCRFFESDHVPIEEVAGLSRSVTCEACGESFKIPTKTVALRLLPLGEDE